jgi:hypothetical protein
MSIKSVVLRDSCDESGSRFLGASISADGTLTINGQDLGSAVEEFFGEDDFEYEWTWTIKPREVARLVAVLEFGEYFLAALANRFSGEAAAGLHEFLEKNEIAYSAWSRTGG